MNILIAPDSFKGSLTALTAGSIMKKAFLDVLPDAHLEVIPMADGGEGTLDTLLFVTDGIKLKLEAKGPYGTPITAEYGVLGDNKTVVIEIAKIVGIELVSNMDKNPLLTTTFGIGEVINDAIDKGYRDFIIGLGGSATTDGGIGMLQALGVKFLNKDGKFVKPVCGSVADVCDVDFTNLNPKIQNCTFHIASDVENPLCGEQGATAVFGPQKGVSSSMIKQLDEALLHYSTVIDHQLKESFQNYKGAGAAGGLGYAFLTIGGDITSGAKLVAEKVNLHDKIKEADWVITGEGQSDFQTLFGKVPGYIGKMARLNQVKALLLSGSLGNGFEDLYKYFISCDSIVNGPMSLQECMDNAEELLHKKTCNIARLLKYLTAGESVKETHI